MENRIMFFGNGGMDINAADFGRAMARLNKKVNVATKESNDGIVISVDGKPCGVLLKISGQEPECGRAVQRHVRRLEQADNSDDRNYFLDQMKQSKWIIFAQFSDQLTNPGSAHAAFIDAASYLSKKGLGVVYDDMAGFMGNERILWDIMLPEEEPEAKPTTEVVGHTPTGANIYQHSGVKNFTETYTQPPGNSNYKKIEEHVSTWLGASSTVVHEIVSTDVHIDVIIVDPTEKRPFYTLVTAGMSDRPMNAPADLKEWQFAELMLCLPAKWDLPDPFNPAREIAPEYYWPIHGLKALARMPHKFNTFLCWGHTIGGEDGGIPIAPGLKFNTWLIESPLLVNPEFRTLAIGEHDMIHFWSILPIYQEETDLKLKKGLETLEKRFNKYGVTELIDPQRPNTCKKKFGIF